MNRIASEMDTTPSLTTTYSYDANGNVISVSETNGSMTTYSYDARSCVIQETDTVGVIIDTKTYAYDTAGNLISETDSAGSVTTFAYDAHGDLISMIDPNRDDIRFAYFAVPSRRLGRCCCWASRASATQVIARRGAL